MAIQQGIRLPPEIVKQIIDNSNLVEQLKARIVELETDLKNLREDEQRRIEAARASIRFFGIATREMENNYHPDPTRCHWASDANVQGGKYWLARCEGGRFGVEGCRCGKE